MRGVGEAHKRRGTTREDEKRGAPARERAGRDEVNA